eukprot:472628-Prymnesium_polylepis.2
MACRKVTVVSTLFKGKNKDGDFKWMVKQPENSDALFVIAENFLDSMRDDWDEGAGTAVLRPLCPQRVKPGQTPRAVGVPTGWSVAAMGFPFMDSVFIKTAIDLSLDRIALVLDQHPQYTRLVYSADADSPRLIGVKIFESTLSDEVRTYISDGLHNIANRVPQKSTLKSIRKQELKLLPHTLLASESINGKASRKRGREDEGASSSKRPAAARGPPASSRQTTLFTSHTRPFS